MSKSGKSLEKFLPVGIVDILMTKASSSIFRAGANEFADALLEDQYQKYIKRKVTSIRNRLDWFERVEYYLGKTAIARGNAFNVKRRLAFLFNEITLENGFRVDSYIPGIAIISRKATDLEDIMEETFEYYLKELKSKYSPGSKINKTTQNRLKNIGNPPQSVGETLSGQMVLEIPSSNQSFKYIEKYKKLAADYGIRIDFAPE